jgi:hypothetical protein
VISGPRCAFCRVTQPPPGHNQEYGRCQRGDHGVDDKQRGIDRRERLTRNRVRQQNKGPDVERRVEQVAGDQGAPLGPVVHPGHHHRPAYLRQDKPGVEAHAHCVLVGVRPGELGQQPRAKECPQDEGAGQGSPFLSGLFLAASSEVDLLEEDSDQTTRQTLRGGPYSIKTVRLV